MARTQPVLTLAALLLTATAHAGNPQAPRPPQAPPIAPAEAQAPGSLFLVAADAALNVAPQAPAVAPGGATPAVTPTSFWKTCPCGPDCACGCNQGQPCRCGNPPVAAYLAYHQPTAVATPTASHWQCGPDGCRLVTGGGYSYGGSCGPGGCGVSYGAPAYSSGGGRFFGGGRRGFFRGGFRRGGGGCASCGG